MATNQQAYLRLQVAALNAIAAYSHAKTAQAQDTLMNIYLAFDAEMDSMIASDLQKNSSQYTALTQELKNVKDDIDRVAQNAAQFVAAAELIAKVASTFAGVFALL